MSPARSGSSAVLVHGFAGTRESMRPVAEALRADSVHVRVPLLPGHETSWKDLARTRWQEWAETVDLAVRAAAERGPVTVVGISMGGALALLAAATRPQVQGVVLVNPSLTLSNPLLPLLPVLKHVVPSIASTGQQVIDPDVDYHGYDRVPLAAVDQMRRLWRHLGPRLRDVRQPLLAFRSLADGVAGERSTAIALAGVASARTEEVLLHRSGHIATLDHDGGLIAARVVAFARPADHARPLDITAIEAVAQAAVEDSRE